MSYYIISFENTHRVLRAEKKLKRQFSEVTTIPTPEELSSDCGVSLQIKAESRDIIIAALESEGLPYKDIIESSEDYS